MSNRVAKFGLLVALAFIFSYIEILIPFNFQVPGIKLGLANIVVMVALFTMGKKEAFIISVIRIVLVGLTFGNMAMTIYSLAGGVLSLVVMILAKKISGISIIGVSVSGGVAHNMGQVLVAMYVTKVPQIFKFFPVLMISGLVTGILIGILGGQIIRRIGNFQ